MRKGSRNSELFKQDHNAMIEKTEFLTFEDFEGRVINKIPTAKIEEML